LQIMDIWTSMEKIYIKKNGAFVFKIQKRICKVCIVTQESKPL
jgi:coenzyme F420-reducing hydrogenase alpha subunit